MTDSFVGIDEPTTIDKKADTEQLLVGANTVERERIEVVGAAAAEVARVLNANPASTDYALAVRTLQGAASGTPMFTDPIDRALRDAGKVDIAGFDVALPTGTNEIGGTRMRGQLDDTAPSVPAEDAYADVRITAARGAHANLRNVAGTEIGTAAAPVRTDPTGTTTQPVSIAVAVDVSDRAARLVGQVEGRAASGVAVAGNPNLVGARANLNEPAAVVDGQAVSAWADLLGRLVVLEGHANPELPVTVNGSAAGVVVIAAPAVGTRLVIRKGSVHNRAAAENVISLRDGAAGTIRWTLNAAADGGGVGL